MGTIVSRILPQLAATSGLKVTCINLKITQGETAATWADGYCSSVGECEMNSLGMNTDS